MQVDILIAVLLCVAGLVIGGGAAGFIAFRMGVNHRRQTAEALIGSAEAEAERIKHEAEAAAEASSVKCFEKSCDDAVTSYLANSQLIPFGEAPVINYIAALETEFTNLRIILLGRKAGLTPMEIRGHLRNSYV